MEKEERLKLVYEIFSPSAPVENIELFIGREEQLEKVKETILERGQHAVMYGARGVGKTSLANVISSVFENIVISKVTCNRTDNFVSIWEKALNRIRYFEETRGIGFTSPDGKIVKSLQLPDKEYISPAEIEMVFANFEVNTLLIFDEFDCIDDEQTKVLMADTLKLLSDNISYITVLIIGIADSVSALIGEHPSLERCIKQIRVPLMSADEAFDFIGNSLAILELTISNDLIVKMVEYSTGFPHYLHLLCKFASKYSIDHNSNEILEAGFDYAVHQSIENSDHSLRSAYQLALASAKQKNQFEDVLFAGTLAQTDDQNSFGAEDILPVMMSITQRDLKAESINYNLGMLCKEERGAIFEKTGTRTTARYKFRNPLMKAFVKLKLHKKEIE